MTAAVRGHLQYASGLVTQQNVLRGAENRRTGVRPAQRTGLQKCKCGVLHTFGGVGQFGFIFAERWPDSVCDGRLVRAGRMDASRFGAGVRGGQVHHVWQVDGRMGDET